MIFYHGHMTYDVDKILLFLYYVKWIAALGIY